MQQIEQSGAGTVDRVAAAGLTDVANGFVNEIGVGEYDQNVFLESGCSDAGELRCHRWVGT